MMEYGAESANLRWEGNAATAILCSWIIRRGRNSIIFVCEDESALSKARPDQENDVVFMGGIAAEL